MLSYTILLKAMTLLKVINAWKSKSLRGDPAVRPHAWLIKL